MRKISLQYKHSVFLVLFLAVNLVWCCWFESLFNNLLLLLQPDASIVILHFTYSHFYTWWHVVKCTLGRKSGALMVQMFWLTSIVSLLCAEVDPIMKLRPHLFMVTSCFGLMAKKRVTASAKPHKNHTLRTSERHSGLILKRCGCIRLTKAHISQTYPKRVSENSHHQVCPL